MFTTRKVVPNNNNNLQPVADAKVGTVFHVPITINAVIREIVFADDLPGTMVVGTPMKTLVCSVYGGPLHGQELQVSIPVDHKINVVSSPVVESKVEIVSDRY